jgi:hypothetical protein
MARLCKAGIQLRNQVDDAYPGRDRSSDGWIGDSRHQANPTSDHNPDEKGWVRAIDLDADLDRKRPEEMAYLADQLRKCARKDKRIKYIIYNAKIASAKSLWRWKPYKGVNPHIKHLHISFNKSADLKSRFFNVPMLGGE